MGGGYTAKLGLALGVRAEGVAEMQSILGLTETLEAYYEDTAAFVCVCVCANGMCPNIPLT